MDTVTFNKLLSYIVLILENMTFFICCEKKC